MKNLMAVGVILLMGVGSGTAAASCSDEGYTTQLTKGGPISNRIETALNDKRILATAPGGEEWNEDHCENGALYKVGVSPTDPKDPRAFRGTWNVDGPGGPNSEVTYNYTVGGNSSFSWKLWKNDAEGLCWEDDNGTIIATAPPPGGFSGTCDIP